MKKFDGLNLAKREEVAVGGGEIWRVIPPKSCFPFEIWRVCMAGSNFMPVCSHGSWVNAIETAKLHACG